MDVNYNMTSTLRAQDHGHPPLVLEHHPADSKTARCAIGLDMYNQTITGGVSKSLTSIATDSDHIPCVLVLEHHPADSRLTIAKDGIVQTLSSRMGTGGGNVPLILESNQNHATIKDSEVSNSLPASMGMGGGYVPMIVMQRRFSDIRVKDTEISPTIEDGGGEGGNNLPMIVEENDMSYQEQTGSLLASGYQKLGTQEAANDMFITEDPTYSATTGDFMISSKEQTSTLMARDYKDPPIAAKKNSIVRRLTPDECASLQGFPRDWCNIGDWVDSKGKLHKDADSPKYKAYGNSIAVGYANGQSGFWCWLARRICAQYERQITLGSLFDGIGGFPLAFAAAGAIPVWASEIEEFPIAVTKYHFPEKEECECLDNTQP